MASKITEWKGNTFFSFRGVYKGRNGEELAALVAGVQEPKGEMLVFDIPSRCLPYLPDMSEGSEFQKKGMTHHYSCEGGYGIFFEETDYHKYHLKKVVLNEQTIFEADESAVPVT